MKNVEYYFCNSFKFTYLVRILPRLLFGRKNIVLYYLDSNKASVRIDKHKDFILKVLRNRVKIEKFYVDAGKMRGPNDQSIIDISYIDAVDRIMDEFDDACFNTEGNLSNYLNGRLSVLKGDLKLWVKHQIACPVFDVMLLIEVAAWMASNPKSQLRGKKIGVLIDKKNYCMDLIIDYARKKNLFVFSFWSWREMNTRGIIVFLYQLMQLVAMSIIPLFDSRSRRPNKAKSSVCTFHDALDNFCDYSRRNYNLFWYPESGITSDQISIFSRSSNKMEGAEIKKIKEAGFDLVSCDGLTKRAHTLIPRHWCSPRVFHLFFSNMWECGRLLFKVKTRAQYEQWKMLFLLFVSLPYWEDFFRQNNVKILFKPGSLFSVVDIAGKLAGAVTISYQYSNHFACDMSHYDSCDVFFVWGKAYEKAYRHKHSEVANFIHSGYVFDYAFNSLQERATVLREDFLNKGVDFVLSIFDENLNIANFTCMEGFVFNMVSVYHALFEYAANNPTVGIIIKPKKKWNETFLKSSECTSSIIQYLEKQERIKFLDIAKFPAEAGKASDLAVGMTSNSAAALECWLAGVPSIFYDSAVVGPSNPDYRAGRNKVIFDNTRTMIARIDHYRKTRDLSDGGFADWSQFIEENDPFRDGKANQRIGFYIKTLLSDLDRGLPKEEAVKNANGIYAKQFGEDKISCAYSQNLSDKDKERREVKMDYEQIF